MSHAARIVTLGHSNRTVAELLDLLRAHHIELLVDIRRVPKSGRNPHFNADALAIATEWNPFRDLDWDRMRDRLKAPAVADLRNIYEPATMREAGFRYAGVGRG